MTLTIRKATRTTALWLVGHAEWLALYSHAEKGRRNGGRIGAAAPVLRLEKSYELAFEIRGATAYVHPTGDPLPPPRPLPSPDAP